jgi:hypothetical protein
MTGLDAGFVPQLVSHVQDDKEKRLETSQYPDHYADSKEWLAKNRNAPPE